MAAVSDYAEFRLVLSPDLIMQGSWTVAVDECPVAGLIGPKGSVAPQITRADLAALRSRNGWPNPTSLREIGTAVWKSVMSPGAEAAFLASLQQVAGSPKGLRVVLVLQGQENEVVADTAKVRLSELPVEVLYNDAHHFIGTDLTTPISRSLQQRPDRPPERIVPPLRVLVAVASPSDKPPANIAQELDVVMQATRNLSGPGRMLDVDYIQRATRGEVQAQLAAKPYHVLHFIGHGGFEDIGGVEAPRAYLAFVRPDSDLSDPTDADTLSIMLRNSGVRLVVITACSSAAPTPPVAGLVDAGPLGSAAFDGLAQRLVAGVSGVTAAVAMQFDLEATAAVAFSRSFYENLLRPELPLDAVVTLARLALVAQLQAGHRAWVTPAVYWRAQDGRVFHVDPASTALDDDTLRMLQDCESQLGVYREYVERIAGQPTEAGSPLESLRLDWIAKIEELLTTRSQLFGESVRLRGGRAAAGATVTCRLSLRLRQPATVSLFQVRINYPEDKLAYAGSLAAPGEQTPPAVALLGDGALQVVVVDPAGGQQWVTGDHEMGQLCFAVGPTVPSSVIDIRLSGVQLARNGQSSAIAPIDAVVFVDPDG
jgi:hypothetical protein